MNIADVVARLTRPLGARLRSMIGRCVLEAVDDDKLLQLVKVQALKGMVRDDVENFQQGGVSHVAPLEAEGIFLAIGGDTSHGAVVGLAHRAKRPTGLAAGETKVYAVDPAEGGGVLGLLYLKSDGTVQLIPGDAFVELGGAGGNFAARADLVDTRVDALEAQFEIVRTKFEDHDHVETGGTTNKIPVGQRIPTLIPQLSVACSKVKVT